MKAATPEMEAHLDQEATTLTTLWEITRRDGVVVRLTELDQDIRFDDGRVFISAFGFSRTAISAEEGLRPDVSDLETLLSSETISRDDVIVGRYNFAELRISMVNYEDLTMGEVALKRGQLGEVLLTPSDRVQVELRSMVSILEADIVEKTSPTCRVNVGSAKCSVPLDVADIVRNTQYEVGDYVRVAVAPGTTSEVYGNLIYECVTAGTTDAAEPVYSTAVDSQTTDGTAVFAAREAFRRHGSVVSAASTREFVITVTEPRAVDDWFTLGRIAFESGANVGFEREIKSWAADGTIIVFEPFPFDITAGNVVTVTPGCDKLRATCVAKWVIPGSQDFANGNVFNFRGEPDLPGRDAVLTYPDAQ